MFIVQNALEPAAIRNGIVDLLGQGLAELRVAAAYVTSGGCELLLSAILNAVGPEQFNRIPKRLVTSFDFGLTEPAALRKWSSLASSTVLVSGSERLAHGTLLPTRAFHPKIYAIGRQDGTYGALIGSANLTGRGFSVNTEAAWVQTTLSLHDVDAAFDRAQFGTTGLTDDILSAYEALRTARPAPPEIAQEAAPVDDPGQVRTDRIPEFRKSIEDGLVNPDHFERMWVQGEGFQGGSRNQLELPRGSHRFFGFHFNNYSYPRKITIGEPVLRSGRRTWNDRILSWHGDNQMERMNLPTRTQGGFSYTDSAVMFRKLQDGSFELIVAAWGSDLAKSWRAASGSRELIFRLGRGITTRLVGFL